MLVGLPAYLLDRLQSVLNAATRLIFRKKLYDHITEATASLHWLRARERIIFKVAVMTFKVLHRLAPPYLGPFVRVADLPGRRGLRSADSDELIIPSHRLATVGSRAFPVAGAKIWNGLPICVTSTDSLLTFRRYLKHYLFTLSYPEHHL